VAQGRERCNGTPARVLRSGSLHLIVRRALSYPTSMHGGMARRDLGQRSERVAEAFLQGQRYTIIARNYRCAMGEIDVIAQDRDTVVFVEVRSHTGERFGDPLESVTLRKQRQIAKVALDYVMRQRVKNRPLRFDVIGICWKGNTPQVVHVKNAFDCPIMV
jgi:putative endonuclease